MSDRRRPLAVLLLTPLALVARSGDWLGPVSTVNEPQIAGREVQLDVRGRLLPWPFADDPGRSYDSHVLAQWVLLRGLFDGMPYHYCCFQIDPVSHEPAADRNWANSTAYLRGMMIGFIERLYPYTGDARMLDYVEAFVDYELAHGLTPAGYKWAGVPYPSADPGAADYKGWSARGSDFVEPHVVGEDGYAYVRLYEMTGKERYLEAAIHFADELVKNFQPGDAEQSPWPVRCLARDGRIEGKGMGPYSANVLGPISLFDELMRIGRGDVRRYQRTRTAAWQWLEQYPLRNNVWVGYFEDVAPSFANMNNVIPLELARYLLLHPELDGHWRAHARQLIEWVRSNTRWPKYRVHGAFVTTEQGNGLSFCCNKPNQCCDSHTARLAAVEALYYARTRDPRMREEAFRSLNWVSYFQGLPAQAHAPFGNQWWFNDEFADAPRRLMDAVWAVPEWAPSDESHLLGSTSGVTRIEYGQGKVRYWTFDADAQDVLRLDFRPTIVRAGGRLLRPVRDPSAEGYRYDAATGVLRIHRHGGKAVEVQGEGGRAPSLIVSFDDPHLAAGTPLQGEYPPSLIHWAPGSWRVSAPSGAFGTFHLVSAGGPGPASFRFLSPQLFVGIDAFNPGPAEVELRMKCGAALDYRITLPAGRVQRLRTGWQQACDEVSVKQGGTGTVHFDNLAYSAAQPAPR
jgi:hypothetical protein